MARNNRPASFSNIGAACAACALIEVVERFHGAVRWGGYRRGRNWVIEPRPVTVFSSVAEFRTDIEMSDAFAKHHPELVLAAHADVPGLARHIRGGVASATSAGDKDDDPVAPIDDRG